MQMNRKYRKGELDQAKIDRLKQAGWRPHLDKKCSRYHVTRWDEMYSALVAYKKTHGNCDLPNKCPEHQKLADWTVSQRSKFALKKMPKDRIDKLRALNFTFEPFERERIRKLTWEVSYASACYLIL